MNEREHERQRNSWGGLVLGVALAAVVIALASLLPFAPRRPTPPKPEREAPIGDAVGDPAFARVRSAGEPRPRAPRVRSERRTERAFKRVPVAEAADDLRSPEVPEPGSAEQVADRWARELEDDGATQSSYAAMAGAMRELSIDGAIENLSCRTTLCGARMRFASMTDALRLDADGADPDVSRWMTVISDEPGQLVVEVYWPRDRDQQAQLQ